jgi:hypothetical protein
LFQAWCRLAASRLSRKALARARSGSLELFTGQLVLRDPKDVDHYHALASFFGGHALWKEAARDLISRLAEQYRTAG